MPPNRQKVVIIGGGVGGLTAAHELIERDFDVIVYERRSILGGKATSVRDRSSAPVAGVDPSSDSPGRPGEHGFRFFPGWYKHLPDTMRRIPIRGHRLHTREHSVLDHLVPTDSNLLARYSHDPVPIVLHSPRSANQAQALFSFVRQLSSMGLPLADIVFFLKRLATFLRTPEGERERRYESMSWWAFLEADERSEAFRTLTIATTRTLLAAKAEEASAYTIALMAVRTLFDAPLKSDCVLDGPTNEVWIDPWVLYLKGRGVEFRTEYELDAVNFDGKGPQIESLDFNSSADLIYLRQLREVLSESDGSKAGEKLGKTLKAKGIDWVASNTLSDVHQAAADRIGQLAIRQDRKVRADFYVFAIPVEQMAYYVNRSTTMRSYAPSLRDIVRLSASVDWMAGIQFYLRYPVSLAPGHIVCADSEWALTAIEQTQFWKDVRLPSDVKSILSVDISAWDKKGRFLRKEAFMCDKDEIAAEVWEQLKASFNRPGETEALRDAALVNGQVKGSYHVDDNIVDRYDRKKQAAFAQGFDRAINRVEMTTGGAEDLLQDAESTPDAPFVSGDRLELNAEPLLVNRPGTLRWRPSASTKIVNMFLAADYVNTATNLASMEGANEAARLTVNGILDAVGSKYERCKTWSLDDGEMLAKMAALVSFAERLPGARTSLEAATGAVTAISAIAMRATSNLKQLWKKP
jgi:15-cis-phytoene desaturase